MLIFVLHQHDVNYTAFEFSPSKKSALIIAHPGHELRVYHWLTLARPIVFVLTDGSGRSGKSRLGSTTKILQEAGAVSGPIFGRVTDIDLYHAILRGNFQFFIGVAEDLAKQLDEQQIQYVAGDAVEGYNPAHDLCRLITNTAVAILKHHRQLPVDNFDFLLSGRPDDLSADSCRHTITFRLNDKDFDMKLRAARSYPELREQIEAATNEHGLEAFRTECLRRVNITSPWYRLQETPFYERYGENQVSAGLYSEVIRYSEHMLPLAETLERYVEQCAYKIEDSDHK
jgi:hypothetical protein